MTDQPVRPAPGAPAAVAEQHGGSMSGAPEGHPTPSAPSDAVLDVLGLRMRRGEFVLRNVPPATVYVYERANPAS